MSSALNIVFFSPTSPHLLPNALFSPLNRKIFELLAAPGFLGILLFKGKKTLILQGFSSSRIVVESLLFSAKVRIATPTRNLVGRLRVAWVQIPPSPPKKSVDLRSTDFLCSMHRKQSRQTYRFSPYRRSYRAKTSPAVYSSVIKTSITPVRSAPAMASVLLLPQATATTFLAFLRS